MMRVVVAMQIRKERNKESKKERRKEKEKERFIRVYTCHRTKDI